MNANQPNEETILEQALAFASPEARDAYLQGACGGNPQLRARVESLIEAHEAAGGFLADKSAREAPTVQLTALPLTEGPGTRIGRYKLLQQIGEGGMGVVYMAEQEEPVRRRVALKIIKLGMDTRQVVARFEAERQALALMDHPNIAKVLDGGATESPHPASGHPLPSDGRGAGGEGRSGNSQLSTPNPQLPSGRPYFVMELVQGVPITEFCDKAKLSAKERLKLFILVCQAVQHAHQKGIIHRDIKPSNVMVTLHDGVPVPKVINFGIAKATNQKLTEKTLFTNFATMIGTPAYMSPEQAEMSGLDIDTRTDIYALGVLLYALLTGTTPFPEKRLCSLGYGEMQRVIREEEPERPSTRLRKTRESGELVLGETKSEIRNLKSEIDTDLDWIVMKCLEKDRQRRYETANGLASDIQRHLSNEPVIARPPSAAYRLNKLVRRNKLAVAATAIVAITLLLGVIVSAWQAVLATRARNEARASEQRAQQAAIKEREQHQRAEAQAEVIRQNLYASEMVLGLQALEAKNFGFARDLLDRHRSQPGQADLRRWEWRYLWAATRSDALLDLGTHSNDVYGVAFSPSGKLLATSSLDRTVKLWNTETGREMAVLPHAASVRTAAFSGDGKKLLTASGDGHLRAWDLSTQSEISRIPVGDIGPATGDGCAFSGGGERFANGQSDGTISAWEVASGTKIGAFRAEGPLFCLALSRDGNLLAGGCNLTNWVGVWNLGTGQQVCSFTNHTVPVDALAFSPDGKKLAVANHDGSVKLWDLATRRPVRTFAGHSSWVPALDFSPDGKLLASASTDHTAILWNIETGEETTLHGHLNEVWAIAFSPDSRMLATGTKSDGAVALWSALPRTKKKATEVLRIPGDYRVTPSVFSPDGSALLKPYGEDRTFGVWDTLSLRETSRFPLQLGASPRFAISPSGKLLAVGDEGGTITLLEVTTRREIAQFTNSTAAVVRLAFSRDGRRLGARTADHKIRAWDVESLRLLAEIEGHAGFIVHDNSSVFTFSPDGRTLGVGYGDGSAEIVDLKTGRRLAHLKGHKGGVASVVVLPDGKTAATASYDQAVKLWDLGTQSELATLRGEWLACFALAVSPDGRRLASGGGESVIRLWDAGTRQLVAMIKATPGDDVLDLSFSPDGNSLIAVTRYTLRVWRAPTLTEIDQADRNRRVGM